MYLSGCDKESKETVRKCVEFRKFVHKLTFKASMVVTAGEVRICNHNALVSLAQACRCRQTETRRI